MKKSLLLLVCVFTAGICSPAFAESWSNHELTERLMRLEEKAGLGDPAGSWFDSVAVSGVLEAEAGYEKFDPAEGEEEKSSDAVLATMELGVEAALNEYVSGQAVILWEEDDTEPVDLDTGVITITGGEGFPGFFSAGKMYVPFGSFESSMISDPLTLELGETRESALLFGFGIDGLYGSVYVFNGDVDKADKDSHIDNFGANAGYAVETDDFSFDVGGGYINNILDSDGLGDVAGEMEGDLEDYVGGLAAHAVFSMGPVTLIGEYVTALDEAEFLTDAGVVTADKMAAWNAEMAYAFDLAGKEAVAAVGCQGTNKAGDLLPETRVLGALSVGIYDGATLAFEYLRDEYENDDKADVVTAQLAFEF
jgi:hypothetical protein